MRLTLTHVVLVAVLSAGAGALVGCGSSADTADKMGMADRMDGKMMDGNMMSGDKMGDDKMGVEAPMNDSMEPMKMDGKMSDGKMGDDRMESN